MTAEKELARPVRMTLRSAIQRHQRKRPGHKEDDVHIARSLVIRVAPDYDKQSYGRHRCPGRTIPTLPSRQDVTC